MLMVGSSYGDIAVYPIVSVSEGCVVTFEDDMGKMVTSIVVTDRLENWKSTIGGRKDSVCMPKDIEEQNLVSYKILLSFTSHSVGNATVLYHRHPATGVSVTNALYHSELSPTTDTYTKKGKTLFLL